MAGELVLEGVVHGKPAQPVDGDEHGVPAPGPAQGRRRPLHAGMTLGHFRVVRRRDRALLAAEGLRGVAAEDGVALHVDAALGGQRVARRQHIAVGAHHMGDRIGAEIACRPIADAVARA